MNRSGIGTGGRLGAARIWRKAFAMQRGEHGTARFLYVGACVVGLPMLQAAVLDRPALAQGQLQAQSVQTLSITLAPILFVEAGALAKLPIRVHPGDAIEAGSFIRIRGLPPAAALSEGYLIASGVWAVPLFGLRDLSVTIPGGAQGRSDLTVSLVNVEGTALAETRSVLVIVPPGAVQKSEPPAQMPQTAAPIQPPAPQLVRPAAPIAPALSAEDRARATALMLSGSHHLRQGSIAAARRFFERAAEIGSADAAVAMGDTYEPGELGRLRALGIRPDIELARRWYERALELGAPDALERLHRLPPKS